MRREIFRFIGYPAVCYLVVNLNEKQGPLSCSIRRFGLSDTNIVILLGFVFRSDEESAKSRKSEPARVATGPAHLRDGKEALSWHSPSQ